MSGDHTTNLHYIISNTINPLPIYKSLVLTLSKRHITIKISYCCFIALPIIKGSFSSS